jgi:phosphoserine phosphatase RsbU/P
LRNEENQDFGYDFMIEILRNNKSDNALEIKDEIFERIEIFQGNAVQHDDMTLFVLAFKGKI